MIAFAPDSSVAWFRPTWGWKGVPTCSCFIVSASSAHQVTLHAPALTEQALLRRVIAAARLLPTSLARTDVQPVAPMGGCCRGWLPAHTADPRRIVVFGWRFGSSTLRHPRTAHHSRCFFLNDQCPLMRPPSLSPKQPPGVRRLRHVPPPFALFAVRDGPVPPRQPPGVRRLPRVREAQ